MPFAKAENRGPHGLALMLSTPLQSSTTSLLIPLSPKAIHRLERIRL
jgi:hypothetical protein